MNAPRQPSIAGRALLALALMIGFYGLAFAIAAGLLWIPYADLVYSHRFNVRITAFCLVGGALVLWSIAPRIDRFAPPGPRLERHEHPRLFAEIEGVAHDTRQEMPLDVFLAPEVNAWVAQRGGLMGFGSRRVMGLGLPLLQLLSVAEFRAVLAHEFGHFHGGDAKLGPWVYKTRAAIGRTLRALPSDSSTAFALLRIPFENYGEFFLKVTQSVSRAQEIAADALAARVAGAAHLASGLRKLPSGSAFGSYWGSEVSPLIGAGLRPPLAEGFSRFIAAPEIAVQAAKELDFQLGLTEPARFDSHPPLGLRLASLRFMQEDQFDEGAGDGPKAISLLEHVEETEQRLLAHLIGAEVAGGLAAIRWEDVQRRYYMPIIEANARAAADCLTGVTPAMLPDLSGAFFTRDGKLDRAEASASIADDNRVAGSSLVGSALALALLSVGAELVTEPGRPLLVRVAGEEFDPFSVVERLRRNQLDAKAWRDLVARTGVGNIDLGRLPIRTGC